MASKLASFPSEIPRSACWFQEVEATGTALSAEHYHTPGPVCHHPHSTGESTESPGGAQRIPTRPSAPSFPSPRISQNSCHCPPISQSPGLLFNLQTCRLHPKLLKHNPQGQTQEPLFLTSSSRRFLQTKILSSLPPR